MYGTLTYDENGNLVARAHLFAGADLWDGIEDQPVLCKLTVAYMCEEIERVFGTADVNPWETGPEDDDKREELICTFADRVTEVIHRRTTVVVFRNPGNGHSDMSTAMKLACEPGGSQIGPPSFRLAGGLRG